MGCFLKLTPFFCFPVAKNVRFTLPFVTQQVIIGQAECVIPDWTLGLYCLLPRRADGGDWVVALWQCSLISPSDSMVTRCPLVGGDVDGLCALKCHASGWVALLKSLDPSELSFPVCNLG